MIHLSMGFRNDSSISFDSSINGVSCTFSHIISRTPKFQIESHPQFCSRVIHVQVSQRLPEKALL